MTSTAAKRIKVGIVGGTGYTGVELLRMLSQHPNVELTAITSRKEDGMPVADMYPNLRGHVKLCPRLNQPQLRIPQFEVFVIFTDKTQEPFACQLAHEP